MAPPAVKKADQSNQVYNPPVEAQKALIKNAHPDKRAGDVCLGVVKADGNEALIYSDNDQGGTCNIAGVKAEKVGYIAKSEVNAFIAKYAPPVKKVKAPKIAVTSLVIPKNYQVPKEVKNEIHLFEISGEREVKILSPHVAGLKAFHGDSIALKDNSQQGIKFLCEFIQVEIKTGAFKVTPAQASQISEMCKEGKVPTKPSKFLKELPLHQLLKILEPPPPRGEMMFMRRFESESFKINGRMMEILQKEEPLKK